MLDCFPREKCERAAEKPRCFAVVLRFGGKKTHVSLRPSEERKFLEVIRDRHGRKGGVGGGQLLRTFTAAEEDVTTAHTHPHLARKAHKIQYAFKYN